MSICQLSSVGCNKFITFKFEPSYLVIQALIVCIKRPVSFAIKKKQAHVVVFVCMRMLAAVLNVKAFR